MASSFFGINIGQSALYAAQTNLTVASNNIANADTDGYSRQYSNKRATRAMSTTVGILGTGTEITGVNQYRDNYLDEKYRDAADNLGEYDVKDDLLAQLETIIDESADSGYSKYLDNIYEALQTLSKDPGDETARNAYVTSLESFTEYINDVGSQLMNLQKEANFGISLTVNEINSYAEQLGALNAQIANLELTGDTANDLRDQRNLIIDRLSRLVSVEATEYTDVNGRSSYKVTIDGQVLVDDDTVNSLNLVTRDTLSNSEDSVDLYDIYWDNGNELDLSSNDISGELKGYFEIRDGNNGENFTGTVVSGEGTSTLVVSNPSETDLPDEGEIKVNGITMRYSSYTYDSATDQITFELGAPPTVNGGTAIAEDTSGDEFSGTITWVSSEEVTITNPSNQELPETGTINLDGTTVTYTGYSKSATAPYTITLNIETPAGSNGTEVSVGDDVDYKGVPYYIGQLNEFVRTVAKTFNELNMSGDGGTGVELFNYEGYSGTPALDASDESTYNEITIHNFQVNDAVMDDLDLVETSTDADAGESANDLILDVIGSRDDDSLFAVGTMDSYMQAMIGVLAIDTSQNESMLSSQQEMVTLVENQRLSVSGVNNNEETADLLKFQQSYNLAAKIVSVMDEIYDVTINSMGV